MRPAIAVFLLPLLILLRPAPGFPHGVNLFAWVEGDTVFVESKFSGGRTPKGARIEVYGPRGDKLLEGVTDDRGAFHFKPPQATDLTLVLLAGAGHRAEWKVPREELAHLNPAPAPGPGPLPAAPDARPRTEAPPGEAPSAGVSAAEIESIVERALERQLAPLRRQLAQERSDRYGFRDVAGGLGYILGLVGLVAYLGRGRRQERPGTPHP